jgi:hypothetical protein
MSTVEQSPPTVTVLSIEKYEKKLSKAMKKRKRSENDSDDEELNKKIKKYEDKLSQAKLAFSGGATASSTPQSQAPIDKSGMTLLLFYAYVEPVWKPKQHSEVMKWAQATVEGHGE